MTRTRILVVEDSITVRKRLVEVLAGDPEIEVVGEGGTERKPSSCASRSDRTS